MNYIKRLALIVLSVFLVITLTGCQTKNKEEVQKKFDEFIQNEFVKAMQSDYTTAHVFLENPKDFGVDMSQTEVCLGERITEENIEKNKKEESKSLKEFESFDRDDLTDEQKDTYDIYQYQAELNEKLNDDKFNYYQQLFESMTGIHYQLPTLLADWQLRNEQDVKDLIILVNDVKPYISSILDYTKKQQEKGLLMVDFDEIIEYCDKIVKKGDDSAILEAMQKSIDQLSLEQTLSNNYKDQLKKAFHDSFLVAYQNISDTMNAMKSGKNNEEGYAHFENGKEYYELLLQKSIGSQKSISDVQSLMNKAYSKHYQKLMSIMLKDPHIASSDEPKTNYKSYSEILDNIQENLFSDFPEVKNIRYNIENINEEIASGNGVAAYFNIPAIDGTGQKQLRVNPSTGDINTIQTYHTVAHEGFPGHMYQYAYMYENMTSPYRKTLADSLAYTEGYAVYSQYYAFKYLQNIDTNYLELTKENELATYSIMILGDIGIHSEGWSYDEFKDFVVKKGLPNDDALLSPQYKQLQANPSAFQPYYVGYEEISLLKEKAQDKLGDQFIDKEFHKALLESGTAPFHVVERHIDSYINHQK